MVKSLDEVIERLQYKADNIKAKLEPSYFTECIDYLKTLPREESKWTPCSKRLPEDKQRCLTTARIYFTPDHVDEPDNYIGIELNTYSKKIGWLNGNEVIAWRPLPSPYEQAEMKGE